MNGITYIEDFIEHSTDLFSSLINKVDWDERMAARKTASFGNAYNYSQMSYPYQKFLPELSEIVERIQAEMGYAPNNCLINYYQDGSSRMGYHSDRTDILFEDTGVGIVSLGALRTLRFRNIADKAIFRSFDLPSGSFIHMTDAVQEEWQHAIPRSNTDQGRISLTFRKIK